MVTVKVNGVSFYTTKTAIVNRRIGADTNLNEAVAQLYGNLFNAVGISTTISLYDNKMQKHTYEIEIKTR